MTCGVMLRVGQATAQAVPMGPFLHIRAASWSCSDGRGPVLAGPSYGSERTRAIRVVQLGSDESRSSCCQRAAWCCLMRGLLRNPRFAGVVDKVYGVIVVSNMNMTLVPSIWNCRGVANQAASSISSAMFPFWGALAKAPAWTQRQTTYSNGVVVIQSGMLFSTQ